MRESENPQSFLRFKDSIPVKKLCSSSISASFLRRIFFIRKLIPTRVVTSFCAQDRVFGQLDSLVSSQLVVHSLFLVSSEPLGESRFDDSQEKTRVEPRYGLIAAAGGTRDSTDEQRFPHL